MKLFLLFLIGAVIGLFTVILLPFLFVIALHWFILGTREPLSPTDAVQCDAGGEDGDVIIRREALLSEYPIPPAFEAWWKEQNAKRKK